MDFAKMRVELNIYKVVQSHFAPFLDDDSFTGSVRPIWTADIASDDFESQVSMAIYFDPPLANKIDPPFIVYLVAFCFSR